MTSSTNNLEKKRQGRRKPLGKNQLPEAIMRNRAVDIGLRNAKHYYGISTKTLNKNIDRFWTGLM